MQFETFRELVETIASEREDVMITNRSLDSVFVEIFGGKAKFTTVRKNVQKRDYGDFYTEYRGHFECEGKKMKISFELLNECTKSFEIAIKASSPLEAYDGILAFISDKKFKKRVKEIEKRKKNLSYELMSLLRDIEGLERDSGMIKPDVGENILKEINKLGSEKNRLYRKLQEQYGDRVYEISKTDKKFIEIQERMNSLRAERKALRESEGDILVVIRIKKRKIPELMESIKDIGELLEIE